MITIREMNNLINFVNYQSRIIGMLWERTMDDAPLPSFEQYLLDEEKRKDKLRQQEIEFMRQALRDSQTGSQEGG